MTFKNDPATLFAVHNASDHVYLKYKKTSKYLDCVAFYVATAKIDSTHAAVRGRNVLRLRKKKKTPKILSWRSPRRDGSTPRRMPPRMQGSCTRNLAAPSQKPRCGYGKKNVGFLEDVATLLYSF
jgi:hypothetical protein